MKLTLSLTKAKKPYGHTAYTRRSSKGKLVLVSARGVKQEAPSEEKKRVKAEVVPTPISLSGENPYDSDPSDEDNSEGMYHEITKTLIRYQTTTDVDAKKFIEIHLKSLYKVSAKEMRAGVQSVYDELIKDGVIVVTPAKRKDKNAMFVVSPKSQAEKTFEAALALYQAPESKTAVAPNAVRAADLLETEAGITLTTHMRQPKIQRQMADSICRSLAGIAKVFNMDALIPEIKKVGGLRVVTKDAGKLTATNATYHHIGRQITLHKKKGEGSFHHEFGHFLDGLLGKSRTRLGSQLLFAFHDVPSSFRSASEHTELENISADYAASFKAFVEAAKNTTSYKVWGVDHRSPSIVRDPKHVSYLREPWEMFARFFDQWVHQRLTEKHIQPLVHHNDSWNKYKEWNQDFTKEDFKILRPLFEKIIQPHMRKAILLFLDLIKSRPKGSMNKNHSWVARFRTVGSDKWQYIMPDKKELDDEGNLVGVKPATVVRRFFGVETEKEKTARISARIKAPVPYGQTREARLVNTWEIDKDGKKVITGRKLAGEKVTPHGTVVAVEMSPKYAGEVPAGVQDFMASPKQIEAYNEKQALSPAPAMPVKLVLPLADPSKPDDTGNIHVIPVDASVYRKVRGKKETRTIDRKDTYNPADFYGGEAQVKTTSAVNPTKAKAKAGTTLIVRVGAHDPRLVDKYGSEGALEEAIQTRPEATKVTAGQFRFTHKNEEALLKEWGRDIYDISRGAVRAAFTHSAEYKRRYERDEINGQNPHSKNAQASTWLSEKSRALSHDLTTKFMELAREYEPKPDDANDRFDKWILSKMYHGARHICEKEARRVGVEVPIDAHEAHDMGSKELSPLDVADYNKYAPLGKTYLENAISDLPDAHRRIIEMRLWLDSPESDAAERKDIGKRTGKDDEASWELPAEAVHTKALKHFERSFSDIAASHPTGWISPSTGQAAEPSVDTLERWYKTGLKTVLSHFVRSPEAAGEDGEDQIHDPATGLYFNHQGYAVYRWLSIATKLARSIKPRAMPARADFPVTTMILPKPGPKVNRSVRLPVKYPEIDYFEKHPVLKRQLNLAPGPVKLSVRLSTTARKEAPASAYLSVPVASQYGLPETYVKHRPLTMTPEQQRRHQSLQAAHKYMSDLEGRKTPDIAARLASMKTSHEAIKKPFKGQSPDQVARQILSMGSNLSSGDAKKRASAEATIQSLANRFPMSSGVPVSVTDALTLPKHFKEMEPGAQRRELKSRITRLNSIDIEGTANALTSVLQDFKDKVTMLDYAHSQRTGIVKSVSQLANVHTFLFLFEQYEEALDGAIGRLAS